MTGWQADGGSDAPTSARATPSRRRRRVLVSAAAVVVAGAVTFGTVTDGEDRDARTVAPAEARAPAVAPADRFGFSAGCCPAPGGTLVGQFPGMAAAGARWTRNVFSWQYVEPAPPDGATHRYEFAETDRLVAEARANGLQVLALLAYTPAWAADPACADPAAGMCQPASPDAFARFVGAVVERYDGDGEADAPGSPVLGAVEIWNEPNLDRFWQPRPDVVRYAQLLRASYAAAKAADAGAFVVSAGLSPAGGSYAPVEFVQDLYAHGARGSFDALGFHPYSAPVGPGHDASWNAWQQMTRAYPSDGQPDSLRSLMAANGDGAKQIWATEYGTSTCFAHTPESRCLSETQQADLVREAYQTWRSYPWAGPLFWHSYQDVDVTGPDVELNYGVVRSDGSPKPALDAYREMARQR